MKTHVLFMEKKTQKNASAATKIGKKQILHVLKSQKKQSRQGISAGIPTRVALEQREFIRYHRSCNSNFVKGRGAFRVNDAATVADDVCEDMKDCGGSGDRSREVWGRRLAAWRRSLQQRRRRELRFACRTRRPP